MEQVLRRPSCLKLTNQPSNNMAKKKVHFKLKKKKRPNKPHRHPVKKKARKRRQRRPRRGQGNIPHRLVRNAIVRSMRQGLIWLATQSRKRCSVPHTHWNRGTHPNVYILVKVSMLKLWRRKCYRLLGKMGTSSNVYNSSGSVLVGNYLNSMLALSFLMSYFKHWHSFLRLWRKSSGLKLMSWEITSSKFLLRLSPSQDVLGMHPTRSQPSCFKRKEGSRISILKLTSVISAGLSRLSKNSDQNNKIINHCT